MDDLTAQLPTTPSIQPVQPVQPEPAPVVPEPAQPEPEFDDSEPLTAAQLKQMLDERERINAQRAAKEAQAQKTARLQQQWEAELDVTERALIAIEKKYNLEKAVVDNAVRQAIDMTEEFPPQIGLAKHRLRLAKQILSDHIIQTRSNGGTVRQIASDQQKIEAAAQVLQPAAGAIDAQTQATLNEQEASKIAEFDDRFDIIR
jgi:hypothetical protein